MNITQLQEAFKSFSAASKSIESYYELLQKKINFLTLELEKKNLELNNVLSDLKKANDYLNAVLYNIEDIIIVIDENKKVTMINKSAERYLQLNPINVIGKPLDELGIRIIEDVSETYLITNDKKYSVTLSNSKVVNSDGKTKGEVILIRDISRLRELEAQNERNQRLISMGEMAAKIVHEIRNPLCSIELYASILESDIQDPTQKRLAAGISKGISNLNNVLTNMSIFARPNKPAMKTLRLDVIINDCIEMVSPLLESSYTKINKSFIDSQIQGDAELLKQVFLNLIINAIQAKPDDAINNLIEINMSEDKEFVIAAIRDYGAGIRNEHLEKIFDPFFTTKEGGSGLGLSISAKIMQSHNGYIKATSEVQRGSCFSLYFRKDNKIPEIKSIAHHNQIQRTRQRGFDCVERFATNTHS